MQYEEARLLLYLLLKRNSGFAAYMGAHADDIEPYVCDVGMS